MLKNTFLHIPNISKDAELKLWQNNILCWDDITKETEDNIVECKNISTHIIKSKGELLANNYEFFSKCMPFKEHWRAYKEFKSKCCFLDIETTGLSRDYHDITMIGLYNGKKPKLFINGINLEKFKEEIKKYSLIVTFNGQYFDLPFIKHKFPDVEFNQFHFDLRFPLRELGYIGGLKKIESMFGITRNDDVAGMDGIMAIRLWKRYLKGDANALELLKKYNIEDIVNLKTLADWTYEHMRKKVFLSRIH